MEIAETLARLPKTYELPLVVYNDDDASLRAYLESLEMDGRLHVVYIPFQVGKAEAVRSGLQVLLETSTADVVVQLDGHLKQPPEEVAGLVQRLTNTGSNMIVANRYALQSMEDQAHRVAIAGLISTIIEQLTGYQLHDVVCGTRAYVRDLATHFLHFRSFGYGLEVEEILIASSLGASVDEWPIHSKRQEGATGAEKIEDNIHALISYGHEMRMPDPVRATLSFMLSQIKQRRSFEIDLTVFGNSGRIRFDHAGETGPVGGGYSLSR
jgi:hypothetical protein